MARVMHHETLEGLLVGGLPTINGLSDLSCTRARRSATC
jgi:hypothetical protein